MDFLGAHVSVAGGPHTAFARGRKLGCRSLQIFVKSPNRWQGTELDEAKVEAFRAARAARPQPVIAHAAYLINLCSDRQPVLELSLAGLQDELERCRLLGVDALVVHPGAHGGRGPAEGVDAIARSIDRVLAASPADGPRLLLENTAGQGTLLGSSLEQLGEIISRLDDPARVGVCFDTCHAFAAGYRLHEEEGYLATLEALEEGVGLERVGALHLNDSRHPHGSRKDRHANLGRGEIGLQAFSRLALEPPFATIPKVVETPVGEDGRGHARDLRTLRRALR